MECAELAFGTDMPVQDTSSSSRQDHHEDVLSRSSQRWGTARPPSTIDPEHVLTADSAAPSAPDDKTIISKRPAPSEAHAPALLSAFPPGQSLVGLRLEHYELSEFVGGGGMGAVFRATDTRLSRTVAVKILLRDRTDDETIRRFRNEAQNAARLDHPHIARVYYVGEDRGWNFIVFEFIAGENLRDVVDRAGPLRVEDALSYTLQIAEAIAHASGRDVVHRDIKPSNVLLMAGNVVKLVDMGLARLHQVASDADELTASGVTLGTFDYISPEQARDPRAADVRSDIYSLGCTLYLMLTGQPPFPDGTALQKLIRHSTDDPADIRSLRPEVPAPFAQLIAKMLAKRPTQRQQSAAELIADLASVARRTGMAHILPSSVTLAVPEKAPGVLRKVWHIAGAALALLAAIVILDAALPSRSGSVAAKRIPRFARPLPELSAETPVERPTQALPSAPQPGVTGGFATSESLATQPRAIEAPNSPTGDAENLTPDRIAAANLPPKSPLANSEFPVSEVAPPTLAGIGSGAEVVQTKRVVVAPIEVAQPDPENHYVTTLPEACRQAMALGLTEIELHWTGPLLSPPLEISNPRLALKAAPGHHPLLVFQPTSGERHMIRLSGGPAARLSIHGAELKWQTSAGSSDGASLISLVAGQSLEMIDSVLTVEDRAASGGAGPHQIAMISVAARRAGETMMATDPQPMMSQSTTVSLERSIARGAATFLVMPEETSLALRWHQGLLATSRRLLETGGCTADPKFFEKIVLDLKNVTASCPLGLHQMARAPGKGYQMALDVNAEYCILTTGPSTPLFVFSGIPTPDDEELRFQCRGDYNCYPDADVVLLRCLYGSGTERQQDFELDDRRWSTEAHPQVGNPWMHAPASNRPIHELTKEDFLADPSLTAGAGFDPQLLPDAPLGEAPP